MSNAAVNYINKISESCLNESQVKEFLALLEQETDKKRRQDALNCYLKHKELHPSQGTIIAESPVVRHSIDLQYILKTYVNAQRYRDAERKSKNETTWEYVLWMLAAN